MPADKKRVVQRLIKDTIYSLETVQEPNDREFEKLPPVFGTVIKWISTVQSTVETFSEHLKTAEVDEECCKVMESVMKVCDRNAKRLESIVFEVDGSSDPQTEYPTIAKGDALEALMIVLLQRVIQLAKSPPFAEVASSHVEDLEKALADVKALPTSLSESRSSNIFNNASGTQYINTGSAPQHNNHGSGTQFSGSIQNYNAPIPRQQDYPRSG